MPEPTDRQTTLDILRRLAETDLGERLILAGSSGVHAVSTEIPAMTEDVDVLIDADWAAAHEDEVIREMEKAGFQHHLGSPTLTTASGHSVDLVGFSQRDRVDRIGGGERVRIMVFADLSTLLQSAREVVIDEVPTGGRSLSTAALTVAKLMTIRLEKGSKDKIQALLLIEENGDDEELLADLRKLLGRFEPDRIDDAVADAKVAVLSLSADVERANAQTAGYAELLPAAQRGLEILERLVGSTT